MSALIALRSYLYRYRVAMIGGFLFIICANIAALFLPYLIRLAIDSLQSDANGSILIRYAILIIVVGAVQAVLAFNGRYFQTKTSRQEDALNKLMLNRTSIIIAHRLSTIRNVDRIIVMHKGRIVEQGTHEQLLGLQGVYRRLYDFQYAQ